jgi:uncharacterized protein (DUF39 family)
VGSPVFLAGAVGSVAWNGTQFNTEKPRNDRGIPLSNAATLMLVGNAKEMSIEWLRGAYYEKYGTTMYLGVGTAIPLLDEDMAYRVSIRNEDIETTICDYGSEGHPPIRTATYAQLMSGSIDLRGKKVRSAPLSSFRKAREIAEELKRRVVAGSFPVTAPARSFPEHSSVRGLEVIADRRVHA